MISLVTDTLTLLDSLSFNRRLWFLVSFTAKCDPVAKFAQEPIETLMYEAFRFSP